MCNSASLVLVPLVAHYQHMISLGTRALKNITGQVDGKVEHYRTTLARLRQEFLARATVTTEVAVLKMRKDVKKINTQLTEMSSHTLEAGA